MAAIPYVCTVTGFKMLTPTVFELTFEPDQALEFEAGQFISIVVPGAGPGGRDMRRAYSIASAPGVRPLELCVKLVEGGPGTNYLYQLRPGDQFKGLAPYGDFVYEPKPGRHACFISTGTGIAPFRSMIHSASFQYQLPESTLLLFGVREENELLYMQEFTEKKLGTGHLRWVPAISRPVTGEWSGFCGRVTDYLRSLEHEYPWQETEYYLCGGGGMINEMKLILTEHGVPKESIHQEVYYREPKP